MVRTMLESLISDRGGKNRKSLRKELDLNHVEEIERFHFESFYWSYLLNFSGIDLSIACKQDLIFFKPVFFFFSIFFQFQIRQQQIRCKNAVTCLKCGTASFFSK
jgi:hypothetical protein